MGTPDFAVASLQRLVEAGCDVVAVVTMPDKAIGRHHDTLQPSPVKRYATEHDIPVLQPERLKDEAFLEQLRSYKADLQVVVAFRMLPEVVWAMPPKGTFNLHAALLPDYRGAAPINWAIICGETKTGVTTFFLDHDIDTGRIIHRVEEPISPTDDAGTVHDRLMVIGADLVLQTVRDIEAGRAEAVDQAAFAPAATPHAAPKLFRENTEIRWSSHTPQTAYNFIRGLSPYPGAWTTLQTADGRATQLKVYASTVDISGSAIAIALTDIQLAGKRRMAAADFVRGAHLEGAKLIETPSNEGEAQREWLINVKNNAIEVLL